MGRRLGRTNWLAYLLGVWLALVVAAFLVPMNYESRAGTMGIVPLRWPAEASLARSHDVPTLVMFAHPRCPCTRASLRELSIVMASRPDWSIAQVVFVPPSGTEADWNEGEIVEQARGMVDVSVRWDGGGRLARLFGAQTSGQVLLYGKDGELEFSGGITGLRGYEGWNAGRAALIALGRGEKAAVSQTPVFGCPLQWPNILEVAADSAEIP